jgi:Na+/proline symporter
MLGGLVLAFVLIWLALPAGIGLGDAWQIAGATGKTQAVDWGFPVGADGKRHFDWNDRYNVWSGVLGATFLFLSYFGTDQSQVGRYLSGKSLQESRFGLLFNGFVKIPMQFLVLSVGVMVFVFYQFNRPPLHFNEANRARVAGTEHEAAFLRLEGRDDSLFQVKQDVLARLGAALRGGDEAGEGAARAELRGLEQGRQELRRQAADVVRQAAPEAEANDKDFVFIHFILRQIPVGLVGLMLAMIFCASWSTTASELSALSATTVSDIYRRSLAPGRDDTHYFRASRVATVLWGAFIVVFASYADLFDNLIQAVNMVGSIFYGTILGIFFTAFFLPGVQGRAVFWAAVAAQSIIAYLFFFVDKNPYLWYNPLGCGLVMGLSWVLQKVLPNPKNQPPNGKT